MKLSSLYLSTVTNCFISLVTNISNFQIKLKKCENILYLHYIKLYINVNKEEKMHCAFLLGCLIIFGTFLAPTLKLNRTGIVIHI